MPESKAARVLNYFETAPVETAELVLDLARSKMRARKAFSQVRSAAARKRFAKTAAPKAGRPRKTYPASASQEAGQDAAAPV
jgi:hypothetical protein